MRHCCSLVQIQQFLLQSQDIFSDQYHTDKHPRHDQERSESDCRYEADCFLLSE